MEVILNATLKEKESKKGNKYFVIEVELTPSYSKKDIFLEPSEVELVKLFLQSKNANPNK